MVFCEFEEVEVVATVWGGFRAIHGGLGNGEEGEAGWEGEGFLDAGETDVDAVCVHVDIDGGEGGDRVHDEHGVWEGFNDFADGGEVVEDAGGSFRVDKGDSVEAAFGEFLMDGLGVDGLSPFDLDGIGFVTAFACDIDPFIREGAAAEAEDFFPG